MARCKKTLKKSKKDYVMNIMDAHLISFGILFLIFLIMHFSHCSERKDLYNRIMSRDLTDYKINSEKIVKPLKKETIKL